MFFENVSLEEIRKNFDIRKLHADSIVDYKASHIQSNHYPYELEKRLNQYLMEGNINGLQIIAREFSNYPPSSLCNSDTLRSLKNNLICSCALTTRILVKAGIDEKYAYYISDLYINRIESIEDENSLVNLNAIMLLDYLDQINKELVMSEKINSELILKVISYVDTHIYDQLSLAHVADVFNTNSSYLSRLFKQEVSSSFTEYLHNCRMKKAQHLLLLTDTPLIEIADKLGYTTQSHFTTVFKKICGITPKQYRMRCKNS